MGKHLGNKELAAKIEAMLDRCRQREGSDPDLDEAVMRLANALPRLFTLVEYWFIQPASNDAERIRCVAVFRKTSGPAEGGAEYMILSNFASFVPIWRNHGESVVREVAKLV